MSCSSYLFILFLITIGLLWLPWAWGKSQLCIPSDQDLEFDLETPHSLSRLGPALCAILTWRLRLFVCFALLCFALFETGSCFVALSGKELCRPGCLGNLRDLPASASNVGIKGMNHHTRLS